MVLDFAHRLCFLTHSHAKTAMAVLFYGTVKQRRAVLLSAETCITDRIRISSDDPQEMSEVVPFKDFIV
jgi:hypothetical protein